MQALVPEIQLGSIHVIAAGITPTDERAYRVFFTTPHFNADPLVAIQPQTASPVSKLEDLKGHTVVVNQGYTADRIISEIPDIETMRLSSPTVSTGILALQSGRADIYVASRSSIQPFFYAQPNSPFSMTPLENTEEQYALAISKKYPKLYATLEKELTAMKQDGTIASLKKQWNL